MTGTLMTTAPNISTQIREEEARDQAELIQIFNDLRHGFLMSNEQLVELFEKFLACRLFQGRTLDSLSKCGREWLMSFREFVDDVKKIILEKNEGEELQRMFFHFRLAWNSAITEFGGGNLMKPSKAPNKITFHPDPASTLTLETNGGPQSTFSEIQKSAFEATKNDAKTLFNFTKMILASSEFRKLITRAGSIFESLGSTGKGAEEDVWEKAFGDELDQVDKQDMVVGDEECLIEKEEAEYYAGEPERVSERIPERMSQRKSEQQSMFPLTPRSSFSDDIGENHSTKQTHLASELLSETPMEQSQSAKKSVLQQETRLVEEQEISLTRHEKAILLAMKSLFLDLANLPGFPELFLGLKEIWNRANKNLSSAIQKSAVQIDPGTKRRVSTRHLASSLIPPSLAYDTNTRQMLKDLQLFLSAILNGFSLDPLISYISVLADQVEKDYALNDYLSDWYSFAATCIHDPSYMSSSVFESRARYLFRRNATVSAESTKMFQNSLQGMNQEFGKIRNVMKGDHLLMKIKRDATRMGHGLRASTVNQFSKDLTNALVPTVLDVFKFVPISKLVYAGQGTTLVLTNLVISSRNILPKLIDISQTTNFHFETDLVSDPFLKSSSEIVNDRKIVVEGIHLDVSNVNFALKKKSFPSLQDRGVLDVAIPDSSITITESGKTIQVTVNVPRPNLIFKESQHSIVNKLFVKPMMEKKLKKAMEEGIRDNVKSFILSYQNITNQMKLAFV